MAIPPFGTPPTPDASSSKKGKVQLTNDLGGTAAAPQVVATHLASALPVNQGGTGITSFGTGIATWLGTPSSANLAAALTDETGSGSAVFGTSPTIATPTIQNWDGWMADTNTWTFVSSTTGAGAGIITFKITGVDARAWLYPGVKVSWNDATNTPGYGVVETVAFSTDTTVTLVRQNNYVMANHAITAPRYSQFARPSGFPANFSWDVAYTGFNANPSGALNSWSAVGNLITASHGETVNGTTTGGATFPHWSLPAVASAGGGANTQWQFSAAITDNNTNGTNPGLSRVIRNTNTMDAFTNYAGGTWTVGGLGRIRSTTLVYQFGT